LESQAEGNGANPAGMHRVIVEEYILFPTFVFVSKLMRHL
jgi:hypothetical protein